MHVVVSSQHSVPVHVAVHVPVGDFCFFEPLVQLNAEHAVTSQHDDLQLLSVLVVPSHFKEVSVLAVYPVGHEYDEHANLSSAQQAPSVEPTTFRLRYLVAVVQLYAQHFVESHSQQFESVHEPAH